MGPGWLYSQARLLGGGDWKAGPFFLHVVARPLLVVSPAAQSDFLQAAQGSRHMSQETVARNGQSHKAKATKLAQGHLLCWSK